MLLTARALPTRVNLLARLLASIVPASCALISVACSADPTGDDPRGAQPPATVPPATQPPQTAAGASGGFGNPTQTAPRAGSAGAGPAMPAPQSSCKSGQYLGTYTCNLEVIGIPAVLDGDVSFLLEIDETVVPGDCDAEFCPDLVIAEGTGTLFGLAGDTGWGFEGKLEGGLDCRTGQFRATAPDGVYGFAGSTDPNDPDALWTVVDPPLGEFDGTLSGMHGGGPPEGIRGDWDLVDAAELARCTGPFMVELQP